MTNEELIESSIEIPKIQCLIAGITDSYKSDGDVFADFVARYSGSVDTLLPDYAK